MEPVIYSIAVKNFKSLRDTGMLNLKPITIYEYKKRIAPIIP